MSEQWCGLGLASIRSEMAMPSNADKFPCRGENQLAQATHFENAHSNIYTAIFGMEDAPPAPQRQSCRFLPLVAPRRIASQFKWQVFSPDENVQSLHWETCVHSNLYIIKLYIMEPLHSDSTFMTQLSIIIKKESIHKEFCT